VKKRIPEGKKFRQKRDGAQILVNNDFKEVYDMIGKGIDEWMEKGYPVVGAEK